MKPEEIERMQRRIGAKPDRIWGRESIAKCQAHLRALFPKPHPWPKTDQASLTRFYGRPGDESKLVVFNFPYPIFYEGKLVTRGRCHERVAESLLRVLSEIGNRWTGRSDIMEEAQDYGGIYNNRPMRGGSTPSLHARGAAIDLDPDDNGNQVHWPTAADMPLEIMEAFSREGWLCAGAWWGRDAMHSQATQ